MRIKRLQRTLFLRYTPLTQDPKFGGKDDAEIISDRIAKLAPFPWDFVAEEVENGVGEFPTRWVGLVVGEMLVHQRPQPLDGIEMRAVRRDEMQRDPSYGLR